MPAGTPQAKIANLVNSTGGTPSATSTLVDHTASYSQSATENNVSTLAAKVNAILDWLKRNR